jgi:prolyl-tRNA editing enzyme YbaK/EbsC (Cys-tRNA(Pro) deacylase)
VVSSSAVARVASALEAAGAEAGLRTFTEPVPTAAAAAAVLGCQIGAIANSLIFDADGEPLLVLASGAHRVDTVALARALGVRRIRRASPEFVLEHAGQEVGGVAPVGHPSPLRTVIDPDLAAFPVLWAGGGDHLTMFATSFGQLLELTKGAVVAVT